MLTDKIAFVSGGTRGIGFSIVDALSEKGAQVYFCARDEEKVESVRDSLSRKGRKVVGLVADVTNRDDRERVIGRLVEEKKGFDILVNNAGRSGGGETQSISDELWDGVIETNLNSLFRMTREALNRSGMQERGWGRIINIASTGGKQGVALGAPYSASKHGVVGFTKALGLELARTGITVNAVCPGFVETELAEQVRKGYGEHWNCSPEEALKRIENRIPLGRYVRPEEVAEMVAFLCLPLSGSITAQALNVCGGLGNY
ncbi:MAG: SDR family NAD(P)-dependent oxidoreductase [Spirochaetales bacterium]|nr:SDR family NAD(P)-dependent oxidoreductase [Spirochaetales bacterium]